MNIEKIQENSMILARNQYFDMDCYKTQMNNNVLVVGTSGAGKTRSIVSPNILQATGSYIVVDPKGNLYGKYNRYLRSKGYDVRKLNFADPGDPQSCSYNFFKYIRSEQDVLKIAHMLVKADKSSQEYSYKIDPFWDESSELLLVSLIGYLHKHAHFRNRTLQDILRLVQLCSVQEGYIDQRVPLDYIFEDIGRINPDDFAVRSYKRFRQAENRTLQNILISLSAKLASFDTKEIRKLLEKNTVPISEMGKQKMALFVVVSDTDRCMDTIVNLFFTQAMNELCRVADSLPEQKLPVDVRFILDDFATNVCIGEFPRMIASIRSRGISTMLMIQAESQLTHAYGEDGRTIIGNCDTYVYLGGNDIGTARNVAERANVPYYEILNMPLGTNWIFRRGQRPVHASNFSLDEFAREKMKQLVPAFQEKGKAMAG